MAKVHFEFQSDRPSRIFLSQLLRDDRFLAVGDLEELPSAHSPSSKFRSEEVRNAEMLGHVGVTSVTIELGVAQGAALLLLERAMAFHGGVVISTELAEMTRKEKPPVPQTKSLDVGTAVKAEEKPAVAEKPKKEPK